MDARKPDRAWPARPEGQLRWAGGHRRGVYLGASVALALLASACAPVGGGGPISAGGADGEWRLTFPAYAGPQPSLTIQRGQANGSGGCNSFGGPVRISGKAIQFGALMATEMACTSDIMDHEASYFAALADARTLERTGDRLTLLDGAGEAVLQFERAASAAAIAEVDWVMASGSWNDRGPSLRVTGDRATGFTGCNRWFAAAALGPGALTFSEVGQTKMACTGPGGAMEREFLDVLARTRAYRVESGFLIVQDDAGRALMRFARAN